MAGPHFHFGDTFYSNEEEITAAIEAGRTISLKSVILNNKEIKEAFKNKHIYHFTAAPDAYTNFVRVCNIDGIDYKLGVVKLEEKNFEDKDFLYTCLGLKNENLDIDSSAYYLVYPEHERLNNFKNTICVALTSKFNSFFIRNPSYILNENQNHHVDVKRVLKYLESAYKVGSTKYQFLELYRALETFTRASILAKLQSSFFKNPKKSLNNALNSLKNERETFAVSMRTVGTLDRFKEFYETLKSFPDGSFATAIREEISKRENPFRNLTPKSDNLTNDQWLGICAVYEIRCSIAHAGEHGIVYEDYQDADSFLGDSSWILEYVILSSLGFVIDDTTA